MANPYLEWHDENQCLHRRDLVDKIFLGRACRGVTPEKRILIKHPAISRDHAVVQLTGNGVTITDQSINGTWVNKVRMAPGASFRLENGDCIQIGGVSICLRCPTELPQNLDDDWSDATAIHPATVTVTNLVADVRGFSAFSQKLGSESAYVMMKEIIASFSDIVASMQGTVKDYAGDAVFAFWEHDPVPSSRRAVMACRAAFQQLESLDRIQRRMRVPHSDGTALRLGWGLTTGSATLSHYGSRSADLALVGDCINLAFRFSSMAAKEFAHTIILCNRTAELVSAELPLVDLGWVETRGRTGKEHIFGIA
jgi:adenylate cyclase